MGCSAGGVLLATPISPLKKAFMIFHFTVLIHCFFGLFSGLISKQTLQWGGFSFITPRDGAGLRSRGRVAAEQGKGGWFLMCFCLFVWVLVFF